MGKLSIELETFKNPLLLYKLEQGCMREVRGERGKKRGERREDRREGREQRGDIREDVGPGLPQVESAEVL